MRALQCPSCGAAYNPAKIRCEYCGSYIVYSDKADIEFSSEEFKEAVRPEKYKGIYVFGILLDPDEYPIRLGPANYFKGMFNSLGGQMVLTNKRIAFISHAFNLGGTQEYNIALNNISKIENGKNFGISANIDVYDASGKKSTFVVFKRVQWMEKMNKALAGEFEPLPEYTISKDPEPSKEQSGNASYIQELKDLKGLLDAGIISQEEFDIKKRILLKI